MRLKSLNTFRFEAGVPACPIACKYCFITEHDARRAVWNANPDVGVNAACTFINVPPWINESCSVQERFRSFPWEILRGDTVGFTAITDPFWPEIEPWFWEFVDRVCGHARLITAVTKWPLRRETLRRLANVPNFRLVVAITGNPPPIERLPVVRHIETLALAREEGVRTLPICHPYIMGVSDMGFLRKLNELGYELFDVKGLRFDSRMASWMPASSVAAYIGHGDQEVLPEDGWRETVRDAGMRLVSPRRWYETERAHVGPTCASVDEAGRLVDAVIARGNIVTSGTDVRAAAIARRLDGNPSVASEYNAL